MANISFELREKIISQALEEIQFARNYKQSKLANWKINENMYYGRKEKSLESRANVDLGQMAAFVHNILAKIDNPLVFKFTKRKDAQVDRVKRLNALRVIDSSNNDWDIKDIAGKKQAIIYGRAIYSYYADSEQGYKPHLDNVDIYDFLIDPSAGGIDIEKASYLGDYGVILSRQDIKKGIKDGTFLRTESNRLLDGSGNSTDNTQETTNERNRTYATGISYAEKEISTIDKFKFWRWGTTYEGQRYYLLLTENGKTAIEVCPIEEKFASGMWWYWSWATFIDLTEFWTPSYCDYVREIFMAQAISVNQTLDNGEQITKPQRVVQVGSIENLAELKYRRDGIIKVATGFDVNQAIQTIQTPSIRTSMELFTLLEGIQEKASGITPEAQGVAENNSGAKASIYKGNLENTADRFGLLNKSYSFGYRRFAKLWQSGVDEHLIKKVSIDLLGADGINTEMVSRRDIFRKDEDFGTIIESSNAELAMSAEAKQTKLVFLQIQGGIPVIPGTAPIQNAQKAYEIGAGIAGFDDETIRQLQDTSDFGNTSLMAKADRDIEDLMEGKSLKPNQAATTAYKQRLVDYMTNNQENMSQEEFQKIFDYIVTLDDVIARNMVRHANDLLFKQKMLQAGQPQQMNTLSPTGAV